MIFWNHVKQVHCHLGFFAFGGPFAQGGVGPHVVGLARWFSETIKTNSSAGSQDTCEFVFG